jgi:probable HAF family extracellular repeat protein
LGRLAGALPPGLKERCTEFYAVTDLGTLGGGQSEASGLNDLGQVVGLSRTSDGEDHAFLWSGGAMTDLGTLGGKTSVATAIDNDGRVVGQSETADGPTHAFLHENGGMIDLSPLLGTALYGSALDINRHGGLIVGSADFGPPGSFDQDHAFRIDLGVGTATDLGTLPGGRSSKAMAINNGGEIVGGSSISTEPWAVSHPWLYTDAMSPIGPPEAVGTAWGINDMGEAVGAVGPPTEAFVFSGGVVSSVPDVSGIGVPRLPYAINNKDQIVGADYAGLGFSTRAFLIEGGKLIDLNSLISPFAGWFLSVATDINDEGLIVGSGIQPDDEYHAFLLTPSETRGFWSAPQIGELIKELGTTAASARMLSGASKLGGGLASVTRDPIPIDRIRPDDEQAYRQLVVELATQSLGPETSYSPLRDFVERAALDVITSLRSLRRGFLGRHRAGG